MERATARIGVPPLDTMKTMSGLDFLKLLRAFIGGEKPHIVYCTVEHDIGIIAMARKEGANDYMMKPFDRKSLEAKFNLSRFAAA